MRKALFAVMLTTVCPMSHAETAMEALKGSAGRLPVAGTVAPPVPAIENAPQEDPFTTEAMEQADIAAVTGIIGRVGYLGKEEPGDCYSYEAVIESRVRGFNPAKWSIIYVDTSNFTKGKKVVALTDTEIRSMITMFDRLHVASTRLADITLVSEVAIKARSCHTRPLVWTVTYRKNPRFD